ncbi:MAG: ComF family protein [Firmicutes bacterium]|nr:ComF family protein [Bacillota bacterium]
MRTFFKIAHKLKFLDIFYVRYCMFCSKAVEYKRPYPLCPSCEERVRPYQGKRCNICSRPIDHDGRCSLCNMTKLYFEKGYCLYEYKDEIRRAVIDFKFSQNPLYFTFFGKNMAEHLLKHNAKYDIITFVPMYNKDERKRGYNQAELLAYETARLTNINFDTLLKKEKSTALQSSLSAKERATNLKKAFALTKDVKGKSILIIDDIITTGATLNECAKVLSKAGAKVDVFALAGVREK